MRLDSLQHYGLKKLPNVSWRCKLNDQLEHELCQFWVLGFPQFMVWGVVLFNLPDACFILRRRAFSGHSGEGRPTKASHWIEWPFTMAHELAHWVWVGPMKENANFGIRMLHSFFWSWIRYSAAISYWNIWQAVFRTKTALLMLNCKDWQEILCSRTFADIREQHRIYPSILPEWRIGGKERYLEVNKVEYGTSFIPWADSTGDFVSQEIKRPTRKVSLR